MTYVNYRAELEKVAQSPVGKLLLGRLGGVERFISSYSQRTFKPEYAAFAALACIVDCCSQGSKSLRDDGATEEQVARWVEKLQVKWLAAERAGARTLNWMITGPARFPVSRNEKATAAERKRRDEFSDFYRNVKGWLVRDNRRSRRRALSERAAEEASGLVGWEMPSLIPDNGDSVDISHLIDTSEAGAWANILPHCFNIEQSEYRPRSRSNPDSASGIDGQPPEGTSGSRDSRKLYGLRMAGNGAPVDDDAGNVTKSGEAPAPALIKPPHSTTDSGKGKR